MAGARSRLSRVLMTGPLAPFAEAYGLELKNRGYTRLTTVTELRQVSRLSLWLEAKGLGVAALTETRADQFLAFQRAVGRSRSQWSRPGLLCLLDMLRGLGLLAAEEQVQRSTPTDKLLASFEGHLLAERGLAVGSVRGYVRHARTFLDGRSPGARSLTELTTGEVTEAILRESTTMSVSATQRFVTGLRAFLRYCSIEGLVDADLSQAALPVTGRRRSTLPKGISKADADAMLESCDRRSALGRRDYAMISTMLGLGLRASEVAGLRLDDFDWRAGEVVVRGKGARVDRLPLPAAMGRAIVAYLQRGRPPSDRRELFLRARAPFEPVAAGTVSSTVRRACRRAGVPVVGSHRLRHTIACQVVAAHVPLTQIAQVLRHQTWIRE